VIHRYFEGFIYAKVAKYEDWIALQLDAATKAEDKMKQYEKKLVVEDGDITSLRFLVRGAECK
jgi:ribosome-binding ATPase YchF (GTP1/OBG family)